MSDSPVETLRKALKDWDIELADGPYFDMLGNVKVRFTPAGAERLADTLWRLTDLQR